MDTLDDVPGASLIEDFITPDEAYDLEATLRHTASTILSRPGREHRFLEVDQGDRLVSGIVSRVSLLMGWVRGPAEVFGNVYPIGHGLSTHSDGASLAKLGLANLTVGAGTPFRLLEPMDPDTDGGIFVSRNGARRDLEVWLPSRSLLVMTGESATIWAHGFEPLDEPRVSVILRRGAPTPSEGPFRITRK